MEKLVPSLNKLIEENQFSEEEAQEYGARVKGEESKIISKKMIEKYGLPFCKKIMGMVNDLSPKEIKKIVKLEFDEIPYYLVEHYPKKFSEKELKLFFNKDGSFKKLLRDRTFDELPDPEWSEKEGTFIPKKKEKVKPKEVELPSQEDFDKLDLKQQREVLIDLGAIR